MSTKPQQIPFSEADLLSAGATLRYIYTLHASNDPECRPRYVGITNNPKKRLGNHYAKKVNGRKVKWIKSVRDSGGKIIMSIVFTFRSDDLKECSIFEAIYIEEYRGKFPDLLNDGAAGVGIAKMSQWHREAISRGNKGKKKSPEHAAKCRVARLGIPHSDEVKMKIGAWSRGKKKSEATIARMKLAAQRRKIEKILDEY